MGLGLLRDKSRFPSSRSLAIVTFCRKKNLFISRYRLFLHIFNLDVVVELSISSVNFLATLHHPQRAYRRYLLEPWLQLKLQTSLSPRLQMAQVRGLDIQLIYLPGN